MKENIERLKNWILKADHDLGTAIVIHQYLPDYSDTISFHCQQAVEKYLKCLLEFNTIEFRRSHDLRYLLDLLDDAVRITNDQYEKAIKLNGFGVEVRYPDLKLDLTKEEKLEAIEIVKEFREFVKKNIDFEISDNKLPCS